MIVAPTAKLATGGGGTHVTVAFAGNPVTTHPAAAAGLGPRFVQVAVPVTTVPAGALAGKPVTSACISACGVIAKGLLSTLFELLGSDVTDPAVVEMFNVPFAGAENVLVQVICDAIGKFAGKGLGLQDCVAPAGRPERVQVGVAATLGPKFEQTPVTVTA